MADSQEQTPVDSPAPRGSGRLRSATAIFGFILLAIGCVLWFSRERIADNVIGAQLRGMDLPATYRIVRIGGQRQVLADIRIGDPARPDLVIERAEVDIAYTIGWPRIASVKLVRPRLYGTYQAGKLSFGTLDRVLFAKKQEPTRLPDLILELEDGRAQLLTDYGPVGAKADGKGNLRSGFDGVLALVAPELRIGDCAARRVSLYGSLKMRAESPRFSGPARLQSLDCAGRAIAWKQAAAQLDLSSDKDFKSLSGEAKLRSSELRWDANRANSVSVDGSATWKDGALSGRVAGELGGVQSSGAAIALLGVDGQIRARGGLDHLEFRGALEGSGVATGPALDRSLVSAQRSTQGTLLAPMLGQIRAVLDRERRGSSLSADLTWRQNGQLWSLIVPTALLRGGSGDALFSLSRFQAAGGRTGAVPLLSGNFSTGGAGLPRVAGRMERGPRGEAMFRLTMAPYHAAGSALALPEMIVRQAFDGSLGFAGTAQLSGAIPGGSARNLVLPVDGSWSSGGALALFRSCVTPRFDELTLGSLALERRSVTLCPRAGRAIVESSGGRTQVAAGATSLDLAGRFGATPIRIRSGPVGFAWPGAVSASALDVALGPEATATRFRLADLSATIGSDVSGRFAGADVQLFSVPMDIVGAAGQWRYAGQKLTIADAAFDLFDRQDPDRFNPMTARGASLSLFNNRIDADALLREKRSDQPVVRTAIRHDLSSGTGHADLFVDGLTFEKGFQPADITPLALGVVANAAGTVTGKGQVDWTVRGVTSSGSFSSDALDFAAEFGPVKGMSGTVRFTDLLGLVTAPDQKVRIASINPGIEVTDGEVGFEIRPGSLLRVHGAKWPFLGGTLELRPVDLNLGVAETRRYVLVVTGLNAAQFVEHMDLENISATGTFDGELPLVFDSNGGRIVGGMLLSRPPGGNVSYVGALTYKDLSAMANFAFDALKSLDYTNMSVGMDGALQGEIVTRVRFDGVKQGAGAKRNIVTRAVADLPIQFNINIRAPFYRLITSVKAMYDPAFIEDPRTLGLVDKDGRPLRGTVNGVRDTGQPVIVLPSPAPSGSVQPPESGKMR